jgi:hypothetical protein
MAAGAFADAGIAVPRVGHARVIFNGRELGVYVLAEPVNRGFLRRHFGSSTGNLYEGSFQDISGRLEQDNGVPASRTELARLCEAASESDPDERRRKLDTILDTEQFLNFLATEMIVANWDGYAHHQNNYRLYRNPGTGRICVIPHGLDGAFSESGLSLMPPRSGLLAAALLARQEERDAFRQRVAYLAPRLLDREVIQTRLAVAVDKLKQGSAPEEQELIDRHATLFLRRVEERVRHLQDELAGNHPPTPTLERGEFVPLSGWIPKPDWNLPQVEPASRDGKSCLTVSAANGYGFSSWRLPVWLPAGRYRFHGLVATASVRGLASMTGSGAGVRVLGGMRGSGIQGSQGLDASPARVHD